jgi:hypothetical protein
VAAPAQQPQQAAPLTKKQIIEQAGLSHPQESTHFLKYMKDHVEKVEKHANRVSNVSKLAFVTAGACLVYQAMSFFSET